MERPYFYGGLYDRIASQLYCMIIWGFNCFSFIYVLAIIIIIIYELITAFFRYQLVYIYNFLLK